MARATRIVTPQVELDAMVKQAKAPQPPVGGPTLANRVIERADHGTRQPRGEELGATKAALECPRCFLEFDEWRGAGQ